MTFADSSRRQWLVRPWTLRLIVGGLALVIGLNVALVEYLTQVAVQIPHESRQHTVTAASLSPEVQDVTTMTSDGLRVAAWWWPVAKPQGAPVILVHGLGGSRADMTKALQLAHEQGRSALAIDLRGHGESSPSLTSFGWRERLDVEAWISWLQTRVGAETHPVLWGTSLGAVTCVLTAAEDGRVGGLIADAPFDTLRHTLTRHAALYYNMPDFPYVPLVAWRISEEDDIPVDRVDCVCAARQIHVPILLIAGELDNRMPPSDVHRIYEAANSPKSWFVIPQTGHSWRPFHPDFCQAVIAFLRQSAAAKGEVSGPATAALQGR